MLVRIFVTSALRVTIAGGKTSSYIAKIGRFGKSFVFQVPARNYSCPTMKIGTHNGCFHCDEALACFLLKSLPRYKDAEIVRTRDPKILDTCDIVVDVGDRYDPSAHRYDHHMREFKETVSTVLKRPDLNSTIRLSSAGLIYCHFGHEVIKQLAPKKLSDEDLDRVFKKIYNGFITEIDAIDNGVEMYDGEPLYRIVTHLSARVDRLNVKPKEEHLDQDEQFAKAVALTGEEFLYFLNSAVNDWLPARAIVQESIEKRFEVDPSGEIAVLSEFVKWIEHYFILEKELNIQPTLKYMIFGEDSYRVRAIPVEPNSFLCRMPLPEPWAGLRAKQLEEVCGIEGAVFVHAARFLGVHETKEGAIAMARKALELGKAGDTKPAS